MKRCQIVLHLNLLKTVVRSGKKWKSVQELEGEEAELEGEEAELQELLKQEKKLLNKRFKGSGKWFYM